MRDFQVLTQSQTIPAEVRQVKAEDPQSVKKYLQTISKEVSAKFLEIGKYLCLIDDREYYLQYGFRNLKEFLEASPELTFEIRTAQMLMRIWRYFGEGRAIKIDQDRLAEIGYLKSYYLTMLFDGGKLNSSNLEEWLDKAKEMSTRRFKLEVDNALGKMDKSEKDLNWKTVSLRVPPDYADIFDEVAQDIAVLEGIEDEDEIRKHKGELIAKALEDWRTYYEPVIYAEEYQSNQERRLWKLKQIKDITENTLGVKVAIFDAETGDRLF